MKSINTLFDLLVKYIYYCDEYFFLFKCRYFCIVEIAAVLDNDIDTSENLINHQTVVIKNKNNINTSSYKRAVDLSDTELIELLNKPPKSTKELRTKSSFQEFFRGMSKERMYFLLDRAYNNLDEENKKIQIGKRLKLVEGILCI